MCLLKVNLYAFSISFRMKVMCYRLNVPPAPGEKKKEGNSIRSNPNSQSDGIWKQGLQ